jgi:diguanylate cyclase (GGDEF)-like protein/PAS domain S-box-containing protein
MSGSRDEDKRQCVLVVDDAATLRAMARDALELAGLAVSEAKDGRDALRAFAEVQPDFVLLDVNMPHLDGYAACEEIRRTVAGENTPILMVTAADDVASIQRAYDAGATDFVTKPVNWLIVTHRIRYMLRMSGVLSDLRRSEQRLAKAQRTARLANWEFHLQSRELVGSNELRRLYGLAEDGRAVSREMLLRSMHPKDREIVLNAAERSVSEGTPLSVDHRVQLASGEERHIHLQAEVVSDADGEPCELSGTAQDITERKRAEQEIRFLAYHDSLTRLGNRRLFRERLGYALAQARRHKTIVGVLALDLDHFKRINDTFGHSVGDLLLQRVADRLTNCVRDCDVVSRGLNEDTNPTLSRFGGDEFMISLCSVRSGDEVGQVAARILEVLARPFELEGQDVVINASIGIAVAPGDGDNVDALLRNSDAAMYHAKHGGRNCYQYYEPAMNEVAQKNLQLESELRTALEREELILHYQPKLELTTERITGFEALLRWQHPRLGMLPPLEFLPIAEQAGLIDAVGEYVLRHACAQAKAWRDEGFGPLRVSVNLSAHQFRTDAIAATVTRVLKETPLSPRCLDVEITENTMMENKGIAVDALRQLKGVGITVSLDDFGTGYSSLSYLKGFPVDSIKIDRSFIAELTTDPDDAAITAAIISMAKTLNLRVVAEGVETAEQLAFLRQHGCEEMQGFLLSPALPADDATEMLRTGPNLEALRGEA